MLIELAVENLGVIESARIPFQPGMTVLSGETGAGKTMIVEALNLLTGAKADPSRVRVGQEQAVVEALFVIADEHIEGEESEYVLRRVVPATGRSRAYVNGSLVSMEELRQLGSQLVEIHGQHGQQQLLSPRYHRIALDQFGNIDTAELQRLTTKLNELKRQQEALGGDERQRLQEMDLLSYQIEEIGRAHLRQGEDSALDEEENRLISAVQYQQHADQVLDLLMGESGAEPALARVIQLLSDLPDFSNAASAARTLQSECEDLSREVRSIGEQSEPDEERLAEVSARRALLAELRRKYGGSIDEVIAFYDQAVERLAELHSFDQRFEELRAEISTCQQHRIKEATRVGEQRRRASEPFAREIEKFLAELGMENARLVVDITDSDEIDGDAANVELLLAANKGMEPAPLRRVASGGELSRVMLALRLVLSDGPPLMVFDEVDAGIGGSTAQTVGAMLRDVSGQSKQSVVVTHLAQVAAAAHSHLCVTKDQTVDTTRTAVVLLDPDDRRIELARMLSGESESQTAQQHADELIARLGAEDVSLRASR